MAYINKYTFSIVSCIYDTCEDDYFECDDLIAPAISLLNKKGYMTNFCCSGHPFPQFSIDLLESKPEVWGDDMIIHKFGDSEDYLNENPNEEFDTELYPYYALVEYLYSSGLYVSFNSNYDFPGLPDIFYIFYGDGFMSIYEKRHKQGIRSSNKFEALEEILKINKIFYNWVKSLPDIN